MVTGDGFAAAAGAIAQRKEPGMLLCGAFAAVLAPDTYFTIKTDFPR